MNLVIDASVAIKWFVAEDGHQEARALLTRGDDLYAPDLIIVETANVAWKKVVRREIDPRQAEDIVRVGLEDILQLVPSVELIGHAWQVSIALNHTIYEGLYIACAEVIGGILVTADERLQSATENTPYDALVRHLEQINQKPASLRISAADMEEIVRLSKLAKRTHKHVYDELGGGFANVKDMEPYLRSPPLQNIGKIIEKLSRDGRVDLLALMWLGQGASGTDWRFMHQRASDWLRGSLNTERLAYLVGLTIYLERGLELFEDIIGPQERT